MYEIAALWDFDFSGGNGVPLKGSAITCETWPFGAKIGGFHVS